MVGCISRHGSGLARTVAAVALISLSSACGLPTDAQSCRPVAATDVVYLDGARFFQAAFDLAKCESADITVAELVEDGTLAILAPSPGFDETELVGFVRQFLEPAGLRPLSVYYYLLTADRVGVAHIPVDGSLEESLDSAAGVLQRVHPPDEPPLPGDPVPFVLLLELVATDEQSLTAALDALASSRFAYQLGYAQSAPPPFDPARDRLAEERSESAGL